MWVELINWITCFLVASGQENAEMYQEHVPLEFTKSSLNSRNMEQNQGQFPSRYVLGTPSYANDHGANMLYTWYNIILRPHSRSHQCIPLQYAESTGSNHWSWCKRFSPESELFWMKIKSMPSIDMAHVPRKWIYRNLELEFRNKDANHSIWWTIGLLQRFWCQNGILIQLSNQTFATGCSVTHFKFITSSH